MSTVTSDDRPYGDTRPAPVMVRIDGKSFRCQCGCNVFHHPDPKQPNLYECNACEERFRGEAMDSKTSKTNNEMRQSMLDDEELSDDEFKARAHRIALEAHEDRLKLWESLHADPRTGARLSDETECGCAAILDAEADRQHKVWIEFVAKTTGEPATSYDTLVRACADMIRKRPSSKALTCVCGEPSTQGVTHRTDGPCYVTPSNGGKSP